MSHYNTLEVPPNASAATIKKAYKRKAHQHHPDRNTGNAEIFHQVTRAYEVLSDPERRAHYDKTGDDNKTPGIQEQAFSFLAELFNYMIENGNLHGDIVQNALKTIENHKAKAQAASQQIKRKREKVKKVANRIDADGDNIFAMVVQNKLDQLNNELDTKNKQLALYAAATKLLQTHKDTAAEQPQTSEMFGTYTTTAFFT